MTMTARKPKAPAKPAKPAKPDRTTRPPKVASTKSTRVTARGDRTYDAIVIGGGHNGLSLIHISEPTRH